VIKQPLGGEQLLQIFCDERFFSGDEMRKYGLAGLNFVAIDAELVGPIKIS
jgi:hypothetical protein